MGFRALKRTGAHIPMPKSVLIHIHDVGPRHCHLADVPRGLEGVAVERKYDDGHGALVRVWGLKV